MLTGLMVDKTMPTLFLDFRHPPVKALVESESPGLDLFLLLLGQLFHSRNIFQYKALLKDRSASFHFCLLFFGQLFH